VKRIALIREQLEKNLQPSQLEILDESEQHKGHEGSKTGRGHFAIKIASPHFKNKSLVECHRMIYTALDDAMKTEIHALRIEIQPS
jgi:BolA protein